MHELKFKRKLDIFAPRNALDENDFYSKISVISDEFYYACIRESASFRLVWIAGAVERVTGYTATELMASDCWTKFIYAGDFERVQTLIESLSPGDTGTHEFRLTCKDNTLRWIHDNYLCEQVSTSNALILYGAARDITDNKLAHDALIESEKKFKSLFDNVPAIAVQGYDKNRTVIYWNEASESLYGYSAQEALGQRLEDLIIPDFMKEDVLHAIKTWIDKGITIPAGEIMLQRKDKSIVPVYSSHVLQRNSLNDPEMFCLDVDLSELNATKQQLICAKEAAESANTTKSEFLANMSHEIRTPLNGIMGMLQLIEAGTSDEMHRVYTQAAMQSCRRLTGLLSDILDLSRVEAGKLNIQANAFHLGECIEQVCELFATNAKQSGVSLLCRIEPGLATHVVGDAARLQQILTNLIGNAFKFTKQGKVELDVHALSPLAPGTCRFLFSVSDTGVGIPTEKLRLLFNPFTQVSGGYTREFQGAGLGLSICKRLIGLMGGNISIESEQDKGTSVFFSLPFGVASDDSQPEFRLEPASQGHSKAVYSILLAEDDAINRMAVAIHLQRSGHSVVAVEDGQQILESLRNSTFDLILMDVQMPVMDGVEATKRIRQGEAGSDKADIPIIAMTAYAMVGDKEEFLRAGMNSYIAKPVNMQALQQLINQCVKPEKA